MMSKYEDYQRASKVYDKHRVATGADVMAAMIQFYSGKNLKDLHVLDAGCGTGNYANALLDMGVGKVTLLDESSGMLDKAKDKLDDYIARGVVNGVIKAKMPPLPFPDGCFDVVMFNVVLNHLDRSNPDFPNSVETLKETRRVLRPGGFIVVSAMTSSTAEKVIWFTQLNPELTKRFVRSAVPSVHDYYKMFEASGITCIQKLNILGSDIYQKYHQLDGPLDPSWRAGSSYWSFATESETEVAVQKVKDLKEKGELESWVKAHDQSSEAGILTIFFCKVCEKTILSK